MNILITSVGRRSYLVKYFKEALENNGKVFVSNSFSHTPAFYYADYSVTTPLIHDKDYIPFLLRYCKENKIKAVVSLFDLDLPILSAHKKRFEEIGVNVIVSDEEVIEICSDKMKTFEFLKENSMNSPATYSSISLVKKEIEKGNLDYPVIIKPRWGMGSIGVFEAESENELDVLYNKTRNNIKYSYLKYESERNLENSIVIQEKLHGQEYGLDIINDLNGIYQTTIVKKKFAMRAGETDAAITENNVTLKEIGEKIGKNLKHIGNLDIDVFMIEDIPYVLEMNARFGGGYPFSHAAGVNLPKAIVKWLNGENISKKILTEDIGVLAHKDIDIVTIKR